MGTHIHEHPATALADVNARVLSAQPMTTLLWALGTVAAALCLHVAWSVHIAWQRHTSRNQLRELDLKTLTDLGLTKDDVGAETRKWFWQG